MKTFIAYAPPENSAPQQDIKLLRDGLSIFALTLPLFWLVYHRLWWAIQNYFMVLFLLGLLGYYGYGQLALLLSAIPGLYLFLEGDSLVRWKWENKGWEPIDVVNAQNLDEAEIRYFDNFLARQPLKKFELNSTDNSKTSMKPPIQSNLKPGLFPMDAGI